MAKALMCICLVTFLLCGLLPISIISYVNAQNLPVNGTLPINDFPTTNKFYGPLFGGTFNFGGSKDDWAYSLQQTRDIGLIMAGQTRSFGHGGSDMWLIKTGITPYYLNGVQKGAFQGEKWNVTFGGSADDGAYSVIQTTDNGFLAAGFTASFGDGGMDMCLIKTDFDGKLQWYNTYGDTGDECAYSVIKANDDGYILSGYTTSGVPSKIAWIVKTDLYGNQIWNMTLPGTSANAAILIQGGYALAVESSNGFQLITTNSTGNILIDQTIHVSGQASTQAIVQADDGGYALAGWVSNSKTGTNDALLVKTDSLGQTLWRQTYTGVGAYALIKTSKGGYALTGDRAVLIITDSNGNLQWNQKYEDRESGSQLTRMQSIIEATPDHFVMDGVGSGYNKEEQKQFQWMYITLKSGDQLIPPKISIIQPENTIYTSRDVPLTFYVSKPIQQYTGVSINGFNFSINGNTTLKNLPNGSYNVTLHVTDSYYNHAFSETIHFTVDSNEPYVGPQVTITSPVSKTTYNTTQITLNFTVDNLVYRAFYSLDGQEKQVAHSNINIQVNRGTHTLTVYSSGITGEKTGSDTVTFYVNATQPWDQTSYPTSSGQYSVAMNQLIQLTVQAATSQSFLFSATIIFGVAISILVVFLVVMTRAGSKQNKQQRMVR